MIDVKLLQKDFSNVSDALLRKKVSLETINKLKKSYDKLKTAKTNYENSQAELNRLSKLFGVYKRDNKNTQDIQNEVNTAKNLVRTSFEKQRKAQVSFDNIINTIPNIPDSDVPDGENEDDNVVIKYVLQPRVFDFNIKDHVDLTEHSNKLLDGIDFKRGVKLSKSRFTVLSNNIAKLERALINYMLDFNSSKGFTEISVPYLVNSNMLKGTGQLPKFKEDLFKIQDEDLYLIPTAEVPLTNLFNDEILDINNFPINLVSHTACFRKEVGSGGKDVRGIIRQHQFHKVELVSITHPDHSDIMLDYMVDCVSELLYSLGLPHRLVLLCGGDLGFSACKTIDIEVWIPSQNKYREISSISNTRDFQARRAKIRFKDGDKNSFVHTLNGSSLAVGRTIVAILENFQQEDGSIVIPEVLQKYLYND